MIITTARRLQSSLAAKAEKLSTDYGLPYKERNGLSIGAFKKKYQDNILIVGKDQLFISPLGEKTELFFHPNLAMVRAKRFMKGEEEPLVSTAKLKAGMSFLDCTLGLASDSVIASLAVGATGTVIGIEGNPLLYILAKEGLKSFTTGNEDFDQAMRRIQVTRSDHAAFLKQAPTDSIDVVYFDPMFQSSIETSNGINTIRGQALMTELTEEIIEEATRVARERVVLKDHWKSERFGQLGFTQHKRKTSLFHYGTLEVKKVSHR